MSHVKNAFNSVLKWTSACLVIFVALNITASLILPLLSSRNTALAERLANDPGSISKDLYNDMPPTYLVEVLTDLVAYFQKGLSYFPHSEYCETPFRSKTLNILSDPTGMTYREGYGQGFRSEDSLVKRIYVFGGSTSMGIFVGDKETWPSQLQRILKAKGSRVEVINYAVSGHSVTEEFLRLYDLIKLGHRPSMVLVMDGLNLGLESDYSKFSQGFFNRIEEAQRGTINVDILRRFFFALPLTKLLLQLAPAKVLEYFFVVKVSQGIANSPLEFYSDKKVVQYQSNRFKSVISDFEWLCNKYQIEFRYFLQPNALYNYNHDSCSACTELSNRNYKNDVGTIYSSIKFGHPEVIDLTCLFQKFQRKAIVDDTHYSPAFNSFLASEVATYVNVDSLKISYIDTDAATGAAFPFFRTN